MTTTPTQQPAPDHGEPWQLTTDFAFDITIRGELAASFDKIEHANRAISCVNACAGMADPAKEIQAMCEAIKGAHDAIQPIYDPLGNETLDTGNPCVCPNPKQGRDLAAALAKLQPFLIP